MRTARAQLGAGLSEIVARNRTAGRKRNPP